MVLIPETIFTKPEIKLIGEDDNIFNLLGIASRALKKAGYSEKAREMQNRIAHSGSYNEALQVIMKYCEVA